MPLQPFSDTREEKSVAFFKQYSWHPALSAGHSVKQSGCAAVGSQEGVKLSFILSRAPSIKGKQKAEQNPVRGNALCDVLLLLCFVCVFLFLCFL
jgi:hypothetical protein